MSQSYDCFVDILKTSNFCDKNDVTIILNKIISITDLCDIVLEYLIEKFIIYVSKRNYATNRIAWIIDIKNNDITYNFEFWREREVIYFAYLTTVFRLTLEEYSKQNLMNEIIVKNIDIPNINYVIDIFDKIKGHILRNSI